MDGRVRVSLPLVTTRITELLSTDAQVFLLTAQMSYIPAESWGEQVPTPSLFTYFAGGTVKQEHPSVSHADQDVSRLGDGSDTQQNYE